MDDNKKFFNKFTAIITLICTLIVSVTSVFVFKIKNVNTSYVINSENSIALQKQLDAVELGSYNTDIYGLININTASKEVLMLLEGIGDKKAEAIIEYRATTPFKNIHDIKKVKGIGDNLFKKIKEFICTD